MLTRGRRRDDHRFAAERRDDDLGASGHGLAVSRACDVLVAFSANRERDLPDTSGRDGDGYFGAIAANAAKIGGTILAASRYY